MRNFAFGFVSLIISMSSAWAMDPTDWAPYVESLNQKCARSLLTGLNTQYAALHLAKEDALWADLMALASSKEGLQAKSEAELKQWAGTPRHLAQVRQALKQSHLEPEVRQGLMEWEAYFRANSQPDYGFLRRTLAKVFQGRQTTRELFSQWLHAEEALTAAKSAHKWTFEAGGKVRPTTISAARLLVKNDPSVEIREGALKTLESHGAFILENGFLPILRLRQQVARRFGYANYYDWRVQSNERMTMDQLFTLLDRIELETRAPAQAAVKYYADKFGAAAMKPYNFDFMTRGDLTREMDPYFPFAMVLERFGRTFSAMGVDFKGASLTMDLVDRDGKTPNGFIRARVPSHTHLERGFQPAQTWFASNAIPGQVGSGRDATNTVFHEGGHFANFSNITTYSMAASQEEAPTSISAAETHSMFFDALLDNAMWLGRYARDVEGNPIPWDLVERHLSELHRRRALDIRAMLIVPYLERELYTLPDSELTAENIQRLAKEIEKRMLFMEGSSRPALSVNHISSMEASAYYHGYILAEFAVYATQAHFERRYGYIVDNPNVGPEMAAAYWYPGNGISFSDMIQRLTGEPFSVDAGLKAINESPDEFLLRQQTLYRQGREITPEALPIDLNGQFIVIHGDESITATQGKSFQQMSAEFSHWIHRQETRSGTP